MSDTHEFEHATLGAGDGRTEARKTAAVMTALKSTYVPCATCGERSASTVAGDDTLVCRSCREGAPRPLTVAEARRRLAAAMMK